LKIPDTHTAIIDTATWEKAQAVNEKMSKWTKNACEPHVYLFSGKLFCGDCKVVMMPHSEKRHTGKGMEDCAERRVSYSCKTYHVSGRQSCSRHGTNEEALIKLILDNIRQHAALITLDEKRMTADLHKRLIGDFSTDKADTQKQLRELKRTLHNLDLKLEQLYEDKITGAVSVDIFTKLAAKTETERNGTAEKITLLEQGAKEAITRVSDIQNWVRLIKENAAVTEMDRSLLDTLIERVEIGESKIENGVKSQDVRIIYKFVGVV